ncbi:DNA repair protein [Salix suchowensis]|nr:DNA repair protein [Salix suchowensis]
MAGGLLDDMVPHLPPPQQYSSGVSQNGINIAATPEDEKEKKRKSDAKYRLSCKKRKEELGINLQKLREENARLKRENRSCWEENNSMVEKLQSKEVAIGNLKREIGDSKKVFSNQKDCWRHCHKTLLCNN